VLLYSITALILTAWAVWMWWLGWGRSRSLRALALPTYLLGLIAFYGVTNPYLLPWYFAIVQGPWIVVVSAVALGSSAQTRPAEVLRLCLIVGLLLTAGTDLLESTAVPAGTNLLRYGAAGASESAKLDAIGRAADWLQDNTTETATVSSNEIGILGYRLDREIVDAYALITPAALAYLPVPIGERGPLPGVISSAFVRDMQPDYVVVVPLYAQTSILQDPWFTNSYQLVHQEQAESAAPNERVVLVFKKRAWLTGQVPTSCSTVPEERCPASRLL